MRTVLADGPIAVATSGVAPSAARILDPHTGHPAPEFWKRNQLVNDTAVVRNTGQVPYTSDDPASFTDDLSDVLDDARYNGDADHGATFAAPVLSWSGALEVDQSVTITYSVTVNQPDKGDHTLTNAAVGGSNCPAGSTDLNCAPPPVRIADYTVVKAASTTTAVPGETVTYTVTVTNTGTVDFDDEKPAAFTDDLSGVLDDAAFGSADNGAAFDGEHLLSWSGLEPRGSGGADITTSYDRLSRRRGRPHPRLTAAPVGTYEAMSEPDRRLCAKRWLRVAARYAQTASRKPAGGCLVRRAAVGRRRRPARAGRRRARKSSELTALSRPKRV